MKKIMISLSLLFAMGVTGAYAQSTLTPEEQVKQAQKQLQEAQAALAKAQEEAKKAQEQAAEAQKQATEAQQQAAETQQGWTIPTAPVTTPRKTTQQKQAEYDPKSDPKYLAGAVTTDADGKVVFRRHIELPGKTKAELYQAIQEELTELTSGDQEITGSRISLLNPSEGTVVASVKEWIVFQSTFLSLDRTEVDYNLIVNCHDGSVDAEIRNIVFRYEQERPTGFVAPADDVISDQQALNKKGSKLSRGFGKFRRGMIDRKDQIFDEIQNLFK